MSSRIFSAIKLEGRVDEGLFKAHMQLDPGVRIFYFANTDCRRIVGR